MKTISALLLLLIALPVFSQDQPVTDRVLKEVCDCLNEDEREVTDFDQYMDLINGCAAMPVYLNANELADEMGIEMDGLSSYERIGEQLGAQLAINCPKMISIVGNLMQSDDDFGNELMDYRSRMYAMAGLDDETYDYSDSYEYTYAYPSETGVVKAISNDFPCMLTLETDQGETLQFYWLGEIGEEEEVTADPGSLIGKTITLTYETMDVYVPSKKSYLNKKIIFLLEEVNKN